MKARGWICWAAIGFVLVIAAAHASAYGKDIPKGTRVGQHPGALPRWPRGLSELVNTTNRVWGYWLNSETVFFFSGGQSELKAFLRDYSQLEGINRGRLVLHDGVGEAKSPWEKSGRPCDWKLYMSEGIDRIVVEVHFWTDGRIALAQLDIPKNVVVERAK
jgi:hypothetical protein